MARYRKECHDHLMKIVSRKNWVDTRGDHRNDIYIDANMQLAVAEDLEAYKQIVEAVIKTVRGELMLDQEYGMPYFETIFNNNAGEAMWASSVTQLVTGLDFVRSIQSFTHSINHQKRTLEYELVIVTDIGNLTVTE